MKIVQTNPRPRPSRLILTKEEGELLLNIYNLLLDLESESEIEAMEILEDFTDEYISNKDKEIISIDLDNYYEYD